MSSNLTLFAGKYSPILLMFFGLIVLPLKNLDNSSFFVSCKHPIRIISALYFWNFFNLANKAYANILLKVHAEKIITSASSG